MVVPSSVRSIGPPPDPSTVPPRSTYPPNDNPPVGTTGPNAEPGFGSQHVLTDAGELAVMPWAGWPAAWQTPTTQHFELSKNLDIVFACIDTNARIAADMPFFVTDSKDKRIGNPSWLENPQPELYTSWIEFFRQVWVSYQAAGEAFVVATSRFADGKPRTFMCLHPALVSPTINLSTGLRQYYVNGEDITDQILHIRYQTSQLTARGIGPLEYAGAKVHAAQVLSRYGSELAENGGVPWAVLQHKFRLGPDQAVRLKNQWVTAARNRMGAPAILDSDTQIRELNVNPKDMSLSDLLAASEARLCVLMGVPPFLMGLPSGGDPLTYSTDAGIRRFHWLAMLKPGAQFIVAALSEWALPLHTTLRLNPDKYIEENALLRAQTYQIHLAMGTITVDEIRAAESWPPHDSQVQPPVAQQVSTTDEKEPEKANA